MPATDELILTRHQRRVRWAFNIAWYVFEAVCAIVALGVCAGMGFAVYVEFTADFYPDEAFDVVNNCEVLDVIYSYNNDSESQGLCFDQFLYIWKLPDSAVTFKQLEARPRAFGECLLELDISEANASFTNGTARCYRVKQLFESYKEFFNCAQIFEDNNATASPCQTLFRPTSSYDASVVVGVVIFLGAYAVCQAALSCAEQFEQQEEQHQPLNILQQYEEELLQQQQEDEEEYEDDGDEDEDEDEADGDEDDEDDEEVQGEEDEVHDKEEEEEEEAQGKKEEEEGVWP